MTHIGDMKEMETGEEFSFPVSSIPHTFSKEERLCKQYLFDALLTEGNSFVKYPLRIVYKISTEPGDVPARIAISVSKKRFKRAVKRNRIKRLIRESYRLNKSVLNTPTPYPIDVLFIYLDAQLPEYSKIEKSVVSAMKKITALLSDNHNEHE